jgi:hypothetical protein
MRICAMLASLEDKIGAVAACSPKPRGKYLILLIRIVAF